MKRLLSESTTALHQSATLHCDTCQCTLHCLIVVALWRGATVELSGLMQCTAVVSGLAQCSAVWQQQCLCCKLQLSSGIRKPGSSSSHRLKRPTLKISPMHSGAEQILSLLPFYCFLESNSNTAAALLHLFQLLLHRFLSKLTTRVSFQNRKDSFQLHGIQQFFYLL